MNHSKRIAFLVHNLEGGGIQRVVINLLNALAKREDVLLDLVVCSAKVKKFDDLISETVRLIDLDTEIEFRTKSLIRIIPAISNYLKQEKPDILLSHLPYINGLTWLGKIISGFKDVKLIFVEHCLLAHNVFEQESSSSKSKNKWQILPNLLPRLIRWIYPQVNTLVTVSQGMAGYLERELKMKQNSVKVIYNPVIDESLFSQSKLPLDHPWFESDDPPVILAVGRLSAQKDYPTLLRAFASLRANRQVRLIILGDGSLRHQLEALINELGIETDVLLPGFVQTPYAYMSRSAVLVLSSVWEGLPTVLIEALACGCQVVSTQCPHGPDEILQSGEYGWLVPMGDIPALTDSIKQALDSPIDPDILRRRAQDFTIDRAVAEYLALMGLE